jgi:hypothetical protein
VGVTGQSGSSSAHVEPVTPYAPAQPHGAAASEPVTANGGRDGAISDQPVTPSGGANLRGAENSSRPGRRTHPPQLIWGAIALLVCLGVGGAAVAAGLGSKHPARGAHTDNASAGGLPSTGATTSTLADDTPQSSGSPATTPQPSGGGDSTSATAGTGGDVGSASGQDTDSSDFCSTHTCIANFGNGTGYIVECADGEWSHSGGRSGACSDHGGETATTADDAAGTGATGETGDVGNSGSAGSADGVAAPAGDGPADTLASYWNEVNSGNFTGAVAMETSSEQERASVATFESEQPRIRVMWITSSSPVGTDQAAARISFYAANSTGSDLTCRHFSIDALMVQSGGSWQYAGPAPGTTTIDQDSNGNPNCPS